MAKEKIFTASNLLTISRLFLGIIAFFLLIYSKNIETVAVMIIAGMTDLFDGYLARILKQETILGGRLDPIVDKIFIGFVLLGIFIRENMTAWIYALIVAVILYIVFGSYFFRKLKKPFLIGKVFIWVEFISLMLFIIEAPYKWIFFYIACASLLVMGIFYIIKIMVAKE